MKQLIQVGVLGAALLFALVGAYLVHFDEGESVKVDGDGVAVYIAEEGQLRSMTWTDDERTLRIEKKNDGSDYLFVSITTKDKVIPDLPVAVAGDSDSTDDTDAPPPPPPEPEIVETTRTFVGNAQAQELWEDLAPFQADRELTGEPQPEVDFGFDEPYATLTVERATGPAEVIFGAATFGDRARYVKSGDKTFLVKRRAISRFQSTDKLMERDVHPLKSADVESITVARPDGTSRTLIQGNPDDRAKAYWADEATPDTRDATASAWAPRLIGLRASAYVDASEVSTLGTEQVLTATLSGEGAEHTITMYQTTEEPRTWYAETSYNRGWVELTASQAEGLLDELDALLTGTSEAPAPE